MSVTQDNSREAVTARMMAAARRHPTGLLCGALMSLDRKRRLDDAERLTRAVLIDVLCERHPEADAAFDAWAADDTTTPPRGAAEAICAAALAAAQEPTRAGLTKGAGQ